MAVRKRNPMESYRFFQRMLKFAVIEAFSFLHNLVIPCQPGEVWSLARIHPFKALSHWSDTIAELTHAHNKFIGNRPCWILIVSNKKDRQFQRKLMVAHSVLAPTDFQSNFLFSDTIHRKFLFYFFWEWRSFHAFSSLKFLEKSIDKNISKMNTKLNF